MKPLQDLALRAVRCADWCWMDGMVADTDLTTYAIRLPDLEHPGTVECLRALVLKAAGPEAAGAADVVGLIAALEARR